MTIPIQSELRKWALSEETEPLILGSSRFLVAKGWIDQWLKLNDGDNGMSERLAIDNTDLLDGDDLRVGISESNFQAVTPSLWNKLLSCHGLKDGQKPIERKVIEVGSFIKSLELELYPVKLHLVYSKSATNQQLQTFSQSTLVSELYKTAKEMFEIDSKAEIRIAYSYMSSEPFYVTDGDQTLSEAGFASRGLAIFVEKEGNKWPNPMEVKTIYSPLINSLMVAEKKDYPPLTGIGGLPNVSNGSSNHVITSIAKSMPKISTQDYPKVQKRQAGICPLMNIGNTCFMNAVLQCLCHVQELVDYVLSLDPDNMRNGEADRVLQCFYTINLHIWKQLMDPVTEKILKEFKHALSSYSNKFTDYNQQDAHECLMSLRSAMHESLKKEGAIPVLLNKEKLTNEERKFLEGPEVQRGKEEICDWFFGCSEERKSCRNCKDKRKTTHIFYELSIPLPVLHVYFIADDQKGKQFEVNICTIKTTEDLLNRISNLVSLPKKKLRFADCSDSTFKSIIDVTKTFAPINHFEQLTVYQVQPITDSNVCIGIYIKKDGRFVGIPRMVSVPDRVSADEVKSALKEKCSAFITGLSEDEDDDFAWSFVDLEGKKVNVDCSIDEAIIFKEGDVISLEFNSYHVNITPITWGAVKYDGKELKLDECLEHYFSEEHIDDFTCERCSSKGSSMMEQLILLPLYLVIQLKRFNRTKKLKSKVQCPVRDLKLRDSWLVDTLQTKCSYSLVSVINHSGELNGGHYTACAKHHELNKWYRFDDSCTPKEELESQLVSEQAYILVYRRE